MNSNSLLITINFKIYQRHSQLTEINWAKINICVFQVHIICNISTIQGLSFT